MARVNTRRCWNCGACIDGAIPAESKACNECAEPNRTVRCALDHQWTAMVELRRFALPYQPGRRARYGIESSVTPSNCPTCGHKWAQIDPKMTALVEATE